MTGGLKEAKRMLSQQKDGVVGKRGQIMQP